MLRARNSTMLGPTWKRLRKHIDFWPTAVTSQKPSVPLGRYGKTSKRNGRRTNKKGLSSSLGDARSPADVRDL
jgi:hypothetical protein